MDLMVNCNRLTLVQAPWFTCFLTSSVTVCIYTYTHTHIFLLLGVNSEGFGVQAIHTFIYLFFA